MNLKDAIATVWIKNVMMRQGLPPGDPSVVDQPAPTAPADTKSTSWLPVVAAAIAGSALPLAGALGLGASKWFASDEQPAATVGAEAPQSDGSLYQFLEDHDLHLPQ